jgi:aldehyde dehydrogenase (NAD+)
MQILQHLLPSKNLSPDTLKDIARKLEDGGTLEDIPVSTLQGGVDGLTPNDVTEATDPEVEQVEDLHDQLGCLMEDSLGEYRKNLAQRGWSQSLMPIRIRWCIC